MANEINIESKGDRDLFRQRFESGDPLRDWYDEFTIAYALVQCFDKMDESKESSD